MITIRHLLLQRNLLFHQAYKKPKRDDSMFVWHQIHTLQYYLWHEHKVVPFYENKISCKNAIEYLGLRFFDTNQMYTLYSDGSLCVRNIKIQKIYVYQLEDLPFRFYDFNMNLHYTTCRKNEALYLIMLYQHALKKKW